MRYSHVLGAAVVGLAAATAVQAGMSVSIVPVSNYTAGAPTAGVPAGARTFDLMVTTDAGTKWASADLQFSLASTGAFTGTAFYNPTGDADIEPTSPALPNLAFDTFVSSARLSTGNSHGTSILGKAQYPAESGTGSAVFPSNASPGTVVDIAWGDTSSGNVDGLPADGTYRVARFTVTGNGGANLFGRIGATNNSIPPVTFSNLYLPIKGDVNSDRIVDLGDFNVWLANGGTGTLGGAPLLAQGDINHDGIIDLGDFNDWLSNGGNQLPAAGAALGAVVPEPAGLTLAAILGLSLAARRRRA